MLPPIPDPSASFESLRQRAEARLRHAVPASGLFTPAQVQELLLELETHQIKLQLQHEELLAAHAAAEVARAEYADLYEHAPVAFVTLTATGLIERANQRARQLLGTEAGQLIGRRFLVFVAEPSRLACAAWLAALPVASATHTTEATLLTAAGMPWAAQLEGLAGPAQAGGCPCRVVLLDIRERHRAAAALHRSQERARLALAAAGAGVVEWDCATDAVFLDEPARTLFGLPGPPAPLPLRELAPRVLAADRPALAAALDQAAAGQSLTLEFRVVGAAGSVRYLAAHCEVVFAAGMRLHLTGLMRDVTVRRQALAEAARLRQSQQQAVFDAVLATQEEERRRMAESLHNGVGQLLYLAKLRLEQVPHPATEPVRTLLTEAIRDVRAVSVELAPPVLADFGLHQALEALSQRLPAEQVRVHSTWQGLTPELPRPLATVIYRIVQELLTNVLRHAHAEEVFLYVAREGDQVAIGVDDDGRGFVPGAVSPEPAGLGLAGIRGRMALLGGTFQVISRPGAGTSVVVTLPVRPQAQQMQPEG